MDELETRRYTDGRANALESGSPPSGKAPAHLMDASRARRADACAVLFALLFPTLITWVYFIALAEQPAFVQGTALAVGKLIQFTFPAVWFFEVQGRRPQWKRPGRAGVILGLAFGLFVFALIVATYHAWLKPQGYLASAGQEILRKVSRFGIHTRPAYWVMAAFYSIPHSLLEEYYWRWFAFGQLRRLIPWRPAALVASAGFMGHHVLVLGSYFGWFSLATVVFSLGVAVGGAVWCWLYQRSGSLVGPWLSHLLVDVAIFVIGYDLVGASLV